MCARNFTSSATRQEKGGGGGGGGGHVPLVPYAGSATGDVSCILPLGYPISRTATLWRLFVDLSISSKRVSHCFHSISYANVAKHQNSALVMPNAVYMVSQMSLTKRQQQQQYNLEMYLDHISSSGSCGRVSGP